MQNNAPRRFIDSSLLHKHAATVNRERARAEAAKVDQNAGTDRICR